MIGMTRSDLFSNCDDGAFFFLLLQTNPLWGTENVSSDSGNVKIYLIYLFIYFTENTHVQSFVVVRGAVAPPLAEWR